MSEGSYDMETSTPKSIMSTAFPTKLKEWLNTQPNIEKSHVGPLWKLIGILDVKPISTCFVIVTGVPEVDANRKGKVKKDVRRRRRRIESVKIGRNRMIQACRKLYPLINVFSTRLVKSGTFPHFLNNYNLGVATSLTDYSAR